MIVNQLRCFFARMQKIDEKVAQIVNARHVKFADVENIGRTKHAKYVPGTQVWYRRPPNSGGKLDTRWLGPARITKRTGEHTYEIRVSEGYTMDAHETFLKPHFLDSAWGEAMPKYFHQRTTINRKTVPPQ